MKKVCAFLFLACCNFFDLTSFQEKLKSDEKGKNIFELSQNYLLEDQHPAKPILDRLFTVGCPLKSISDMHAAGFTDIANRSRGMRVLAHPDLAGYLIKAYPLNEKNNAAKDASWAIKRCFYAQQIRDLINQRQFKYFCVPMKWVYVLPNKEELSKKGIKNYVVLVVEDMQLVPKAESIRLWAHLQSTEVIDELYAIFTCGYSSARLPVNMPFTKSGKFACIDTESQKVNKASYERVYKYLSKNMQAYFKQLLTEGQNK